jgi:hypothetical protein
LNKFLWEIFNFRHARQAEIKVGQQQANQRHERKTDRQDRMQIADILFGRIATDKTERRVSNRKMGADDRLAERQTDL